jgi:L-rhamnose mutarotase
MKVNPDRHEEYISRHNPIWPELQSVLVEHGVKSYSIFLDRQTSELFAYAEIDSLERWETIASSEICKKWWMHMAAIMPSNPDSSPVSTELVEVFHIEG